MSVEEAVETVNLEGLDPESSELEKKLAAKRAEKEKKLKELKEATAEEETEEELEEEESDVDEIVRVLKGQGLTMERIEQVKDAFGTLYSFPFTAEKIFVFRSILKKEWDSLLELAEGDEEVLASEALKVAVIFPALTDKGINKLPAGVPSLLFNLITTASGFVSIDQAIALVRQI